MDPMERIEAFWAGERPDQIPYTIYWWDWRHIADDPAWQPMFEQGLRVTYQACTLASKTQNVEYSEEAYEENGKKLTRQMMRTPVGEIYKILEQDWTQKYWLEIAQDYRVMKYIVENTQLVPDYEALDRTKKEAASHGVAHVSLGARSPMQTILVDYVGLENFAFHLIDLEQEVMELYEVLLKNFRKAVEIVAAGPGRYVSVLENFTAETMGPERFAKYHMPVYKQLYPILQSSGKIVGNHYDGKLAACKQLVGEAPTDVIESLTPPPEGDMTLSECRAAWPDKLFWSNINLATYQLEPKKIRETILDAVQQAAPDGRRLAFEISEAIPDNWKESIPIVLEALKETRG
jgi:hypothetical protein